MYDKAIKYFDELARFEHSFALLTLEKYVNGALIQWNRIQQAKAALPRLGEGVDPKTLELTMLTLALDTHFYFICCDKVQNLIRHLAQVDGDPKLKDLWQRHQSAFKPFNDARNHLEHIETRMSPKYIYDLGKLEDDTYTFGGERFDISAASLKILTDAYEEMINILRARKRAPSSAAG